MNPFEQLPYSRIVFTCAWDQPPARFPSPLAWRDMLEWHFRKICCVASLKQCEHCVLKNGCLFTSFFKPELTADRAKNGSRSVALPFVLVFPFSDAYIPGESFTFELVLFGQSMEQFPYWAAAVERMGSSRTRKFKIGKVVSDTASGQRALYSLETDSFVCDPGITVPPLMESNGHWRIVLQTPTRLFKKGRPLLQPSSTDIIHAALNRFRVLDTAFGSGPGVCDENIDTLRREAASIVLESQDLHWEEKHFYSRRQKQTVSLSGLTGTIEFAGNLEPFAPLLLRTAHWGIGKSTALGLGRYRLFTM